MIETLVDVYILRYRTIGYDQCLPVSISESVFQLQKRHDPSLSFTKGERKASVGGVVDIVVNEIEDNRLVRFIYCHKCGIVEDDMEFDSMLHREGWRYKTYGPETTLRMTDCKQQIGQKRPNCI